MQTQSNYCSMIFIIPIKWNNYEKVFDIKR